MAPCSSSTAARRRARSARRPAANRTPASSSSRSATEPEGSEAPDVPGLRLFVETFGPCARRRAVVFCARSVWGAPMRIALLQLAEDFLTAIVFLAIYLASGNLVLAVGSAIAVGIVQFAWLR